MPLIKTRRDIREHKVVPFFGIGREFSKENLSDWEQGIFKATPLKGKQQYYLHLLEL